MRVHWLQHAEHEGLGCIGPWLERRKFRVRATRLQDGDSLPHADEFDWLIVMGGPMNIYEHGRHPWLIREKKLIREACAADKKVLGICLGAQLLADVLGARVSENPFQEIGWFDVELTEEGRRNGLLDGLPERMPVFHWHGDTFAIPSGCQNLMKSDACVNQAFAPSPRRLGVQFHLEVTYDDAQRWLAGDAPTPDRYVQPASEILRDPARFAQMNRWMEHILDRLAAA